MKFHLNGIETQGREVKLSIFDMGMPPDHVCDGRKIRQDRSNQEALR